MKRSRTAKGPLTGAFSFSVAWAPFEARELAALSGDDVLLAVSAALG